MVLLTPSTQIEG